MSKPILALVDCNNFYVSCERVFKPSLHGQAVVVLSNNDGCIIARSNEAKALGIPMGAPYFKIRDLLEQHQVKIFSSNYQLYGDMSARVMHSLFMLAPSVEVYSIDEAFIRLETLTCNLQTYADDLCNKIMQWTGIPVSLGLAPSKTLTKVANHIAKKQCFSRVCDLRTPAAQCDALALLPIENVWGISERWGKKLRAVGITTALELRNADLSFIRQHLNVVGEKIARELRGCQCFFEDEPLPKKSILRSRSFSQALKTVEEVRQALSTFTARACEKLRASNSRACGVQIFIETSRFIHPNAQYNRSISVELKSPSADTRYINNKVERLLSKIFKQGYGYKRCGVMLFNLSPNAFTQTHLFTNSSSTTNECLMTLIDCINQKMGARTLFYLCEKPSGCRQPSIRTMRYTTQWDELPKVV